MDWIYVPPAGLDDFSLGMPYPPLYMDGNGLQVQAFTALNNTGQRRAWILLCPKDGTLNRVGFDVGSVANNPDNGATISFQTVDPTTGNPDGTQDQFRTGETVTQNTWKESNLLTDDGTDTGVKRTVTAGEPLAVVIEHTNFTAGDSFVIQRNILGPWRQTHPQVYPTEYDGATWTKASSSGAHILAIQYDDDIWYPIIGCLPFMTTAAANFSNASNPDEQGMRFETPYAMRVNAFVMAGNWLTGATATSEFHLWDLAGNELASGIYDPEIVSGASVQALTRVYFQDNDTVDLEAGTEYRVTLEATGAGNINIPTATAPNSGYLTAMPWGNAVKTSRIQGGAWTDSTSGEQVPIGLNVLAIGFPSGGVGRGLYDRRGKYRKRGIYE